MPSTYTWSDSAGGDWTGSTVWKLIDGPGATPPVPAAGDTASIDLAGNFTLDVASGEAVAAGVVSLDASGVTLDIEGMLDIESAAAPGRIELQQGTIQIDGRGSLDMAGAGGQGTLVLAGGALLLTGFEGTLANLTVKGDTSQFLPTFGVSGANGGTLDNVTIDGVFNLSGSTNVTVTKGLHVASAGGGAGVIKIKGFTSGSLPSGLDFVGDQSLDNVTIDLGSPAIDFPYEAYLETSTATPSDLTLDAHSTLDVVGMAMLTGNFTEQGVINIQANGNLDLSRASLTFAGAIDMTGLDASLVVSPSFSSTVSGFKVTDTIGVADLPGILPPDTAAIDATTNVLTFYDGLGHSLFTVQLAAPASGVNYADFAFNPGTENDPGTGGALTAVLAGQVVYSWQIPSGGEFADTDFNAAANWLVGGSAAASGPGQSSIAEFNTGGNTYSVTGFGIVADLDITLDIVTFQGGLSVSGLMFVGNTGGAAATLENGIYSLGTVEDSASTFEIDDAASVTLGAGDSSSDSTIGALQIDGNGTFDSKAMLTVTTGIFLNDGTVIINSETSVSGGMSSNSIVGGFAAAGNFNNTNGTTLTPTGTLTTSTLDIANNGDLILDGGVLDTPIFELAGGRVELASGSFVLPLTTLDSGTADVDGGTSMDLTGAAAGAITVNLTGAHATLDFSDVAAFAGTIGAVGTADTLTFGGAPVSFVGYKIGGDGTGILTLDVNGTDRTLSFANGKALSAGAFSSAGADDIAVTPTACFVTGTKILTSRGELPVECLQPGDLVATLAGRLAPVRWLGHRRIATRAHPRPCEVRPVRVAAHAFGTDQPRRAMWLSPDHAVFLTQHAMLVPIRYLLNGATVAQVPMTEVTYWHVELDRHEVLLAEGLAAESYLDTGNRAAFADGIAPVFAHVDQREIA